MSKRNWLAAIAFGLIAFGALAQDAGRPAPENPPMPEAQQDQGASTRQQDATAEPGYADRLLTGIERIEPAIRDLIAEEDEIARKRQENRDIRDLAAQEQMAIWARRVFWVTLASVLVTGVGIFFVWRTLNANTAAVEQAREANRIARSEQRPWISLDIDVTQVHVFNNGEAFVNGNIIVKNIGTSPTNCVELMEVYSFRDVQSKRDKVVNSARGAKLIFNLLPNQEANRLLIGSARNDDLIYVTSAVSYVFDGHKFITSATWSICSVEHGDGTMTSFSQGVFHGKESILVREIHELNVVE